MAIVTKPVGRAVVSIEEHRAALKLRDQALAQRDIAISQRDAFRDQLRELAKALETELDSARRTGGYAPVEDQQRRAWCDELVRHAEAMAVEVEAGGKA